MYYSSLTGEDFVVCVDLWAEGVSGSEMGHAGEVSEERPVRAPQFDQRVAYQRDVHPVPRLSEKDVSLFMPTPLGSLPIVAGCVLQTQHGLMST